MSHARFAFDKPHTLLAALVVAVIALPTGMGSCTMEPGYRRPDAPVT